MIEVLAAIALAATVSALVIAARLRFRDRGLDLPGHRSLHAMPTPHGGGLGIVAAALAIGAWAGVESRWLVAVLALAGVSLADDWLHLPFWVRLVVHVAVSASVVFAHDAVPAVTTAFAILLMAWATNAYNFMDGADGLAGSMALAGFGAYAVGFGGAGMEAMALMCAGVAAAAAAFLFFNWHPARIFMGDVGSIPLGFLAGGLGWHGVVTGAWPAWFPLLVFAPFLCDASVTSVTFRTQQPRISQRNVSLQSFFVIRCYERCRNIDHGMTRTTSGQGIITMIQRVRKSWRRCDSLSRHHLKNLSVVRTESLLITHWVTCR